MPPERPIKLYDFASSPNCQRVIVVMEEKKLPYEKVPVDLKKMEQKKPDFLKLNPYGKVPVIIDGATVLYESLIINEYLEEKYPETPLLPKDPGKRAKARILLDYGMNHLDGSYQKIRKEMMKDEKERDQRLIEDARRELRHLLGRLERELGDQPYLAGEFSLVDAALIPRFLRLAGMGVLPDPSLPNMAKWIERMKQRPSVQKIL
ncbi:MAG TPA: glutathione S-transferase family protein [Candidatus Binatia bacterium]|nr:glutathione S-transferase family protein [Candidatus Binatia bacterium]